MRTYVTLMFAGVAVLGLTAASASSTPVPVDWDNPDQPIRLVTSAEIQAIHGLLDLAKTSIMQPVATRRTHSRTIPAHAVALAMDSPDNELWVTSIRHSNETFQALRNGKVRVTFSYVTTYNQGPPSLGTTSFDVAVGPHRQIVAVSPYGIDEFHRDASLLESGRGYW